jgi:hypothetical protein
MLEGVPAQLALSYEEVLRALALDPGLALICEPYIVRAWREIAAGRLEARQAADFLQAAVGLLTEPLRPPRGQPGPDSVKVARLIDGYIRRARKIQDFYHNHRKAELTGDQLPVIDYRDQRVTIDDLGWPRAVAFTVVGHMLDLKPDSIERHLKKARKMHRT